MRFTKTAGAGVLAALMTAIFAAAAGASISPTLTLDQGAGTTAGSSPPTGLDINFRPLFSDSVKDLAISLPEGFMINLGMAGGECLGSSVPSPNCRLGSGTINGPLGTPVALYLVAPPTLSDVAGVALAIEGGSTTTGDLTMETLPAVGFNLSFRFLPPGIGELQFRLNSTRLPTNCSREHEVAVEAASWLGVSGSATSPLTVTGCSSLPYAPTASATVTKRAGTEANVTVVLTQGANESATGTFAFGIPTGMKLNRILGPCFEGLKCNIGTLAAVSPLLPASALADGTLTLAGSLSGNSLSATPAGVALTASFPAPYPFTLVGPVNLSERMITYSNLPDIPFSTMTFSFTGTSQGSAFTTSCAHGTIPLSFTPQSGGTTRTLSGPMINLGCPLPRSRPAAAGSFSGLANGRPKLHLRVVRSGHGPMLRSVAISLPSGLAFDRRALVTERICKHAGSSRSCRRTTAARGLSVSGATVNGEHLAGGALVISFERPTPNISLRAGGPLLVESASLQRESRRHVAGHPAARIRLIDSSGEATALRVP